MDLTGRIFGRLTVVVFECKIRGRRYWKCKCECGNFKTVKTGDLNAGNVRSCGCLIKDSHIIHGKSYNVEYNIWNMMVQRCTNIKAENYRWYGARGITICERWRVFANFYSDMGSRPSSNYSLDRIDNYKGYSPDNCRWVTRDQQANNRR